MKMGWTIYLKALAMKLIDCSLVKQQTVKAGLLSGTKLKALGYAKFRVCPLICPFGRLYFLRQFFEQNRKLLACSWLLIFGLVLSDVKLYILRDLAFRVEVREVILYLLLIDV